jgi:hypothetical protein
MMWGDVGQVTMRVLPTRIIGITAQDISCLEGALRPANLSSVLSPRHLDH